MSARKPKRPPPPGRVNIAKDSEQQRYLESLEQKVSRGRRLSLWLLAGVAAVLLVSLLAWTVHYRSTVLGYAELDPEIRLERKEADPDRLKLLYRPLSEGTVGFRRKDADRETELLDQVVPEALSSEQAFEWRWGGVQTGDTLRVTFRDGWSLATKVLDVPPPHVDPLPPTLLTGEVVNATNNQPMEDVKVEIPGTDLSALTDAGGKFSLPGGPPGTVPVVISAAGFITEELEKELALNETTSMRVALSPGVEKGQIRLVLTWNAEPADLDAHLEGPLPGGERFHVHFGAPGNLKSREFVNLDVDDRDGEGPETITVLGVLPGTYHYFVHDYTNRANMENTALSHSGAEVKVHQYGQTYRFETNNRSLGNHWQVCQIEVAEGNATVKKIDEYESKRMRTATAGTVVLAIDTSSSMRNLIEATKQAGADFLKAVPFDNGAKAGLATFGANTRKLQDVTADREALLRAITPLRASGGTPMTEGLDVAYRMLQGVEEARSIVVFTDGEPDNDQSALRQGERIKEEGIVIWAIGTADADMRFLRQLVSSPDKAFYASPDDLREIFAETAGKIYAPEDDGP